MAKLDSSLERGRKHQTQELEASFVRSLKELKFKQALRTAETLLSIDPGNSRVKEFIPLLEEKVAMDEDDGKESDSGDEDDDGADGAADAGEVPGEGSQDQDSSETSSTEEDEDDDEEDDQSLGVVEHANEGEELIPAHPAAMRRRWLQDDDMRGASAQAASSQLTQISLDNSNSQLTSAVRQRIRADLARSIAGLKERELARQMVESDPLLGA